jgi:hypothetical protein
MKTMSGVCFLFNPSHIQAWPFEWCSSLHFNAVSWQVVLQPLFTVCLKFRPRTFSRWRPNGQAHESLPTCTMTFVNDGYSGVYCLAPAIRPPISVHSLPLMDRLVLVRSLSSTFETFSQIFAHSMPPTPNSTLLLLASTARHLGPPVASSSRLAVDLAGQ